MIGQNKKDLCSNKICPERKALKLQIETQMGCGNVFSEYQPLLTTEAPNFQQSSPTLVHKMPLESQLSS